jgi:type 1 glutamine amidotransferase
MTRIAASLCALALPLGAASAADEPIRALLVVGGCCHDYLHQQTILTKGISARASVVWTIAYDPDGSTSHPNPVYLSPDWSKGIDVVVHDECSADVQAKPFVDAILAPHRKGLPAVNLHCAMHCYRVQGSDDWFQFTGLTTHSHGAQMPIELSFVDRQHPILAGLSEWTTIHEEQYHNETVWSTATPLIRGHQGADDDLVAWTNDFQGTKVFSTTLGHNNETVNDPRYLDLVTRGLLWTVGKLDDRHFHHPVVPINLALGKPATASSTQGDEHAADKAVDGNPATRWCASDGSVPQWWQLRSRCGP